jgi:hypothetical protein
MFCTALLHMIIAKCRASPGIARFELIACVQMTVRLLRTTEKTNVMVFYLMMCTLLYSIIGCIFTYKQLVMPSSLIEITLLIVQGLFGYGNQVRCTLLQRHVFCTSKWRTCFKVGMRQKVQLVLLRIEVGALPFLRAAVSVFNVCTQQNFACDCHHICSLRPRFQGTCAHTLLKKTRSLQVCITKGLAHARAASVMCMQYFSIVISQLAGMLIFQEFTTWQGDVGMALVVSSMAIYMWWESKSKQRR